MCIYLLGVSKSNIDQNDVNKDLATSCSCAKTKENSQLRHPGNRWYGRLSNLTWTPSCISEITSVEIFWVSSELLTKFFVKQENQFESYACVAYASACNMTNMANTPAGIIK